ncbi:MAG TPA: GNAT family N-acetyltransferase [Methylomirabilota bacterium]|nr:GNAT family N-acetyltransferase [Methylomirabilota bacterium]
MRDLAALTTLITEGERSGSRFVGRLATEWASGANRFDKPGEALFVARVEGQPVGVCGLNVDPYTAARRVGRVRHLYVMEAYRRQGIGRRLLADVVAAARGPFDRLRLRTANLEAARFYEAIGFAVCPGEAESTHALDLRGKL